MKHGNFYKLLIIIFAVASTVCAIMAIGGKHEEGGKAVEIGKAESSFSSFVREEAVGSAESESESGTKEEKEETANMTYPDQENQIPDEEISPEGYTEFDGEPNIECYFTNTAGTLDAEGFLPLYAQGILAETAQTWLNENGYPLGELRCIDGSAQTDSDAMSFEVETGNATLLFTYVKAARHWKIKRIK